MTRRLTLRTRLTVFVTLAFAVAMTLIAVVVVDRIEDGLVSDTRSSAEAVLSEYLESINGGVAAVGVVDDQEGTRFFYRDQDGREITESEYFRLIAAGFDREFQALAEAGGVFGSFTVAQSGPIPAGDMALEVGSVLVEPDTGQLVDVSGTAITFVQGPVPDGEPTPIDLGDDVVAVSQTLRFSDGTSFQVGVSSPLRPVTDSLDAIRGLVWFAVPALVLAVAGITWLAATRALAPVHAVSSRARAISAANLSDRLPAPDANDEIRELIETVNDMLARLEQSQDRQRQLVSDVSHELRSPVAASRAQLEVAISAPHDADWAATAATVLGEQEHLSALIDDLLALSRLEETGAVAMRPVELGAIVRAEAGRPRTPEPSVVTRPGLDADVHGNPRLLARAVGNLLDNATRHAVHQVSVSLGRTTSDVVVHIDDDGPGIPEAERQQVFERFARLDEARDRDSGGTGLGLAITREVARAHGGDVACAASPLGGARLTMSIPALDHEDEPPCP